MKYKVKYYYRGSGGAEKIATVSEIVLAGMFANSNIVIMTLETVYK